MPTPRKGEKQRAFIARCMAYPDLKSKPPRQRAGECYGIWRGHHGDSKKAAQPSADISPEKAKQILRDDSAHGHPLTPAQRGMFGAAAGRARKKSGFVTTMAAFRAGTLKDASGQVVTCKKTARALALKACRTAAVPASAVNQGQGGALVGFPEEEHTRKATDKVAATPKCGCACTCHDCKKSLAIYTYKAGAHKGIIHPNDEQDIVTDDNEMSASAILASSRRDRQGDIIECSGVIFDDHRWNPMVLWDHAKMYNIPIGMTETPEGEYTVSYHDDLDIITQKSFFAPTKFARQIYHLIRLKFIRANSIAVKDLEVEKLPPDPDQGHFKPGKHILRSALAEVTWTPLPANPDAVASLLGRGRIDVGGFAEEQIDPLLYKSFLPMLPQKRAWAGGITLKSGLTIVKPRQARTAKVLRP